MKIGFYLRLAITNVKKNYRFFIPRVLAEAGLLAVFYIVYTLKSDDRILEMRGGEYIAVFMSIGTAVMTLLSAILIFYVNSFLMKQRKREFGLYNVLGMEKSHVGRVLFFEALICSILSVCLGLFTGILFYKLCSLLVCKLLGTSVLLGFYFIRPESILPSAFLFVGLDFVSYLCNRITLARLHPVDLLVSKSAGEREPKIKWVTLIAGVLALGAGYGISVTVESPLEAIFLFFVAVILVIVGTYFLFTAGSIFVLKALKKNKRFYYRKNSFTAVSGLIYRMKQNAVGLASIAILATGVLVMISTTVSLYAGLDESLSSRYPYHLYLNADYETEEGNKPIPCEDLLEMLDEVAKSYGAKIETAQDSHSLEVAYQYEKGSFTLNSEFQYDQDLTNLLCVTFLSQNEYNRLSGEHLNLSADEIGFVTLTTDLSGFEAKGNGFTLDGTFYRARRLDYFPIQSRIAETVKCVGIVLPSEADLETVYARQNEVYGEAASVYSDILAVRFADLDQAAKTENAMEEDFWELLDAYCDARPDYTGSQHMSFDCYWTARVNMLSMYGSLLFLGIILGVACLFASALIIYYKQISEGYEDRDRFQILQKVGMSGEEVKKSINGQVVLVFFLPLLVAGMHLCFAFPILEKLLHILLLSSTWLFIKCAVVVYLVFALIYVVIYSATARTYYKIVR